MENWKDIQGYEDYYQVSDLGNIRIKRNGRLKYQSKEKNGYKRTTLSFVDHKSKMFLVHRLVAITFVDNPENKPEIHHINHIKDDNRAINLKWVDKSENQKLAYISGNSYSATAKKVKQFTKEGVFIKEYNSVREAHKLTKTAYTSIRKCCNGEIKSAGGFKWQYNET